MDTTVDCLGARLCSLMHYENLQRDSCQDPRQAEQNRTSLVTCFVFLGGGGLYVVGSVRRTVPINTPNSSAN